MHHLRYFLAVAHELNFTRAARSLNMSVPPLSQRIKSLERELGTALFERSTHHTRLTEAGARLLPLASSVVAQFDSIPRLIGAGTTRPTVRLAIPDALHRRHRRTLGDEIRELEGSFAVVLRQMPSLEMETALLSGTVDIAISHVGGSHPRLSTRLLYDEPFGILVDATRFPGRTSVEAADLSGMRYIRGPRHWYLNDGFSEQFAEIGAVVNADDHFSDLGGLLTFLRGMPSFALAPFESEAFESLDPAEFTVLRVEGFEASMSTYLLQRRDDEWLGPVASSLAIDGVRPTTDPPDGPSRACAAEHQR